MRVRAFEALVRAWDHREEAWMLQAQRRWEPALEALGQSVQGAGQSLAILDGASPEAIPQLGRLRDLINSDLHFQSCSWAELEALWNRNVSSAQSSSVASDLDRANRVLRTFLEATESYHFSRTHPNDQFPRNLLLTVLAGICLVLAGLYARYSYLEPTRAYVTEGQVFWTSAQQPRPSESSSLRFPVEVDGTFHEYTVPLEAPVAMDGLRIDPLMEPDVEVWIERIEIYRPGQTSPLVVRFDQPDLIYDLWGVRGWKFQARRGVSGVNQGMGLTTIKDGTLHFWTGGDDPGVLIRQLNQDQVAGIKIRMKAFFRPGFLHWLYPPSAWSVAMNRSR